MSLLAEANHKYRLFKPGGTMEKTAQINGAPLELFVIHDPANKTTINVRDASDDQLEKAREGAANAQKQLWDNMQNMLSQFQQAAMANAVFTYELDRRKKSLTIATRIFQ
jgi:hypothetical protein